MTEQKKYYPQLDTIRGSFFLMVFFFHAYKPKFGNTFFQKLAAYYYSNIPLTMDMFFVLSAFLLSLLGFREYEKNGFFSFKNYFIRRALRIWPLYFIIMFLAFVFIKIVTLYIGQPISLPPWQWYVFFVSNFYKADHVFFLRILWSLSVEEQFYLVWGICLFLFQKSIKSVILVFSITSIIFITIAALQNMPIFFHTITYLIDMMAGAYAAYCIHKQNYLSKITNKITGIYSILFYCFLPIFFFCCYFIDKNLYGIYNNLFSELLRLIFIAYSSIVIIDQLENKNRVIDFSRTNFLVYTGKISYGLYCFHGFVITFISLLCIKYKINIPAFWLAFIMLCITFSIASLSYKFVERPFLKLKGKLTKY
jgi:peptidoglycan/LPS O-acetylase OafA/YrhL